MKAFLAILLLVYSQLSFAAFTVSNGAQKSIVPTAQSEFEHNKWTGPVSLRNSLGSQLRQAHTTAVGVWDYARTGGKPGFHEVGITLPNKAVIRNVLFDVITKPGDVPDHTAAIGFTTGQAGTGPYTTNDLKTADGPSAWAVGSVAGTPIYATMNTHIKLTAERKIYASILHASLGAGKIKIFVDYVISE